MSFVAYHGASGATHQQKFDELFPRGYRLISLSVYGARSDPRYAAVWVQRAGPAWIGIHGFDGAAYQAKFDELTEQGFLPVLLSGTGSRNDPVFAGTFEQIPAQAFMCRFGLTDGPETEANTLASVNKWARESGCILRSGAIYGGVGDRAYAGVWLPNTENAKWAAVPVGNGGGYQTWFNAFTQLPFRPSWVDVSDDGFYLATFQDDSVGSWTARHGMTADQYQAEFDTQTAAGKIPISVHGGGVDPIRYAAIFADRDVPFDREWHVTEGPEGTNDGIDEVVKRFMQRHNVRAATVAVRKDGSLIHSAGYTWAEPGYPLTADDSLFRLASVSKAFACAGIQQLVDDGDLNLDDAIFPLLGITQAALSTQQPSRWINDISVRHCVDLQGGWDAQAASFDAVFSMRKIARDLGLPGRASAWDIARYMYGEPLQFEPGTQSVYANIGYVLLGLVVEKISGQPFIDYVGTNVLNPIGATDVFVGATLRQDKRPNEVQYDDPNLGESAWDPYSEALVPSCYGGEGWVVESMATGGGLIASGPAVTQFINHNAVWGLDGRAAGFARSGGMAGVASLAVSRHDGIDWCYIFNTRTLPAGALDQLGPELDQAVAASAKPKTVVPLLKGGMRIPVPLK